VAAGIIGDACVRTVLALLDVTAERSRATSLDGSHHTPLGQTQVADIGGAPRLTMAAEDVCDLQLRPGHVRHCSRRQANPLGSCARFDRRAADRAAADRAAGDVAARHAEGLCRRATGSPAGRGPDKIGIIPSAPARASTAGPQIVPPPIVPPVTLPPATPKDSAAEPRGRPQVAALTKL